MKLNINTTLLAADLASRVQAMAQDTAQNNEALIAGLIAQHSRTEGGPPLVKFEPSGSGWRCGTDKGVIECRNGKADGEPATCVMLKRAGCGTQIDFLLGIDGTRALAELLARCAGDRNEHDRDLKFACPHCGQITDCEGACADCRNTQQVEGGA